MPISSADLTSAGALILKAIDTPEAKAVLLELIRAFAATIESKTSNPFLRQGEEWAFSLVQGYLAPTPVTPSAIAPVDLAGSPDPAGLPSE